MRKNIFIVIQIVFASALSPICLYAQMDQLHGDQDWSASGLHSGNQIRTTFWNDGQIGVRRASPGDWDGEWPINSGRNYLSKIATWFGAEVRGTDDILRHIVSESNGTGTATLGNCSSGDSDPDTGLWWTMTPLPFFHNPDPPPDRTDRIRVAMSQWA